MIKISVVIPTFNRHEKLEKTIAGLRNQEFPAAEYEILVVDDGSKPPVSLSEEHVLHPPQMVLIRLEGVERSVARNTGARKARGELLVFVDNDIEVKKNFLTSHWDAHRDFPESLVVGAVILPPEMVDEPFVRFRQHLENNEIPLSRGIIDAKNFCTAQNMAMRRDIFLGLGGFDENISSSEDQDLSMRHTAQGGKIAFLPEALVIHRDSALDIRSYCRRSEWGSRLMLPFYLRYPELPANIERKRVNGEIHWRKEPFSLTLRKIIKSIIAAPIVIALLFRFASVIERISPKSSALNKIYSLLLGAHIFRGYRSAFRINKNKAAAGLDRA